MRNVEYDIMRLTYHHLLFPVYSTKGREVFVLLQIFQYLKKKKKSRSISVALVADEKIRIQILILILMVSDKLNGKTWAELQTFHRLLS